MEEIFLPINGHEGCYEVSNFGRVKSLTRNASRSDGKMHPLKERILKQGLGTNGYPFVCCRKDGKSYFLYIHRLVGLHFLKNHENKSQINHKDGNKLNNNESNLEWCNQSENILHAYKYNLQKNRRGSNNPNYKHGKFILS